METEDLASRYRKWRKRNLGVVTERLERATVLDLRWKESGCWMPVAEIGTYALAAAERGVLVMGVDLSTDMLADARERSVARGVTVDWRQGDVRTLPFPDSSFDVVLAIALLCLVPDPRSAVRELSRVLVPGGTLVIGDPRRLSLWAMQRRMRGWAGHSSWRGTHFRTTSEIQKILADSGLQLGRMRGAAYHPPLGAAARLLALVDLLFSCLGTFGAAFLVVKTPPEWLRMAGRHVFDAFWSITRSHVFVDLRLSWWEPYTGRKLVVAPAADRAGTAAKR